MNNRSILAEAAVILAISLALGTVVHLARGSSAVGSVPALGKSLGDPKLKIAFVGNYGTRCSTLAPTGAAPPTLPPPPVKQAPAPSPPKPEKPEPPKGSQPPVASQPPPKVVPVEPEKPAPPQKPETPAKEAKPARPLPAGVREIGLEEAVEEHKGGVTFFLDARRTRNFDAGRIKGARSFSVWEADLDQKIDAFIKEVPADLSIVIYCGGGDCEDSHDLAERLQLAGFKDMRVFTLGYPAWKKAGHPIEATEGAVEPPPEGEEGHPEGEKAAQKR